MKATKKGDFIFTYSGNKFYYDKIDAKQLHIEDIAHALSLINRFAGHTKRAYSVAKHCAVACQIAPEEYKLEALLHDMLEAITLDIPTPFKHSKHMTGFVNYENLWETEIVKHFKLKGIKPGEVKDIDGDLAYMEACVWLNFDGRSWPEPPGLAQRIKKYQKRWPSFLHDIQTYWLPEATEQIFLNFYNKYKRKD